MQASRITPPLRGSRRDKGEARGRAGGGQTRCPIVDNSISIFPAPAVPEAPSPRLQFFWLMAEGLESMMAGTPGPALPARAEKAYVEIFRQPSSEGQT